MREAERLLTRGLSARQAAGLVGYGSGAAFAKAYRRFAGRAPSSVVLGSGPSSA